MYEYQPEEYEEDTKDNTDTEHDICEYCNGSGDGSHESLSCIKCKGKGEY